MNSDPLWDPLARIHQWNHIRIHFYESSYDFTIFFITLNSYMNSFKWNLCMISWFWIHPHEFINEFIYMCYYMNSDIWFHHILYDHEFISELIIWTHIRFYDHEFICYISWPMNSCMNSCKWRIKQNHTWNHVYQGSRCLNPFQVNMF